MKECMDGWKTKPKRVEEVLRFDFGVENKKYVNSMVKINEMKSSF